MSLATKKMFDDYKQDLSKRMESPTREADPRIIVLKPNTAFRGRLVFYLDPSTERTGPFIDKYVHSCFDPETRKSAFVTCPTSWYLSAKRGFRECPICTNNSQLWNDIQKTKSQTARELYDKFKRKFYGFALVYVVNDPTNADNIGKVKILRYGVTIFNFFQKDIFGKTPNEKNVDENAANAKAIDAVGSAAFDLDEGYDVIIEVGKKQTPEGVFNTYTPKFAREKTSINVNKADLEKQIKDLNFDRDFFTKSSKEDLLAFYQNEVLDVKVDDDDSSSSEPKITDDLDKVAIGGEKSIDKQDQKEIANVNSSDDLNIDEIMADLEKNSN